MNRSGPIPVILLLLFAPCGLCAVIKKPAALDQELGWFRETFQNTGKTDMVRYM